jgi:hypothetical protein
MTAINVTSINVLDNPSKVTNPLQFEIQYECLYDLADGARAARRRRVPPAARRGAQRLSRRASRPRRLAD